MLGAGETRWRLPFSKLCSPLPAKGRGGSVESDQAKIAGIDGSLTRQHGKNIIVFLPLRKWTGDGSRKKKLANGCGFVALFLPTRIGP
jgi:hypothetical protein